LNAGLHDFKDFHYLIEKDIRDMAEDFSKRMQANGCIVFGLGCTKKLTWVMHWIQDCYSANDHPTHCLFNNEVLIEALSLAHIHKSDIDLVVANTKAANPGKVKDERKWPEWEKAFTNYLLVIPGVKGIPLSDVIRKNDNPTKDPYYGSFNEQIISQTPLKGQYYKANARSVHNLIVGFVQGESLENGIQSIAKHQDGKLDMIALQNQYAGEGHSTRCIADARKIQFVLTL
jgi:hypothetical protein